MTNPRDIDINNFMNIGTTELIVILILGLFLYGKRLPEITRALGRGYRAFKENINGIKNDLTRQVVDIAKEVEIKEANKIYPFGQAAATETKEDNPAVKSGDNLAG
ncbi:MAG: twin-arginine translocase TatA/TatE family subunit [Planctomycetota bacterium]